MSIFFPTEQTYLPKPSERKRNSSQKDKFISKLNEYQGNDLNEDEDEADNSLFGTQPEPIPLVALKEEERERTYMSRVVAEKERVAKIRKAQDAAQLIQKSWRNFRLKRTRR